MSKLLAEFLGTLFLCTVALVSGNALAVGFTLAIMIYSLGYVSGGHFNPAVSIAVWLRGKMEKADMLKYFAAQFAGAVAAFVVFKILDGTPEAAAAAVRKVSFFRAAAAEFLFTLLLASTFLHVTTARQLAGNQFYGAAIGLCMVAGAACAGPVSGAALNPALGLGIVLKGSFPAWLLLVYLGVGAAAGAAAAIVYRLLNPND